MGRLLKNPVTPARPLSVGEIEQALATVRASLQEGVDAARDMHSLKAMARTLTEHVIEAKCGRMRTLAAEVFPPLPLHLVCLHHGLPYNDAERLMAMNRIRHPNFVAGEVTLYGR